MRRGHILSAECGGTTIRRLCDDPLSSSWIWDTQQLNISHSLIGCYFTQALLPRWNVLVTQAQYDATLDVSVSFDTALELSHLL